MASCNYASGPKIMKGILNWELENRIWDNPSPQWGRNFSHSFFALSQYSENGKYIKDSDLIYNRTGNELEDDNQRQITCLSSSIEQTKEADDNIILIEEEIQSENLTYSVQETFEDQEELNSNQLINFLIYCLWLRYRLVSTQEDVWFYEILHFNK